LRKSATFCHFCLHALSRPRQNEVFTYFLKLSLPPKQTLQVTQSAAPCGAILRLVFNATCPVRPTRRYYEMLIVCRYCATQRILKVNGLIQRGHGRARTSWVRTCSDDGKWQCPVSFPRLRREVPCWSKEWHSMRRRRTDSTWEHRQRSHARHEGRSEDAEVCSRTRTERESRIL
jgi:hypothetical protein